MFRYRSNPRLSRSSTLRRNRAGPATPVSVNTGRGELLDAAEPLYSFGRLLKAWILLTANSVTFTLCLAVVFGLEVVRLARAVGRPLYLLLVLALWVVFQHLFSASAATAAGCVGDVTLVCYGPPLNTSLFNVTETLVLAGDWLPDAIFLAVHFPNLQVCYFLQTFQNREF
jgi:hypothetical protein